jgi:hypothetical protein
MFLFKKAFLGGEPAKAGLVRHLCLSLSFFLGKGKFKLDRPVVRLIDNSLYI